jgi:hypothetical protein
MSIPTVAPNRDNDRIIQKLEANKADLANTIAQAFLDQKIPGYSNFTAAQLVHLFMPTLEIIFQFFRDGDAAPAKAYITKQAEARIKAGIDLTGIEFGLKVAVSMLENELDRLLADLAKTKATTQTELQALGVKYKSRLESLRTLYQISAILSALNNPTPTETNENKPDIIKPK